jgi:hypothetical protein
LHNFFFQFAKPMFQFGFYPIYVFSSRLTSGKGITTIESDGVTNSMWKVKVSVPILVTLSKLETQMCVVSLKNHDFNCYNCLVYFFVVVVN